MKNQNPNSNLENEIIIGFHLIRKSATSLAEDLKYFNEIPNHFSDAQIVNILGEIAEVEEHIKKIRQVTQKNHQISR